MVEAKAWYFVRSYQESKSFGRVRRNNLRALVGGGVGSRRRRFDSPGELAVAGHGIAEVNTASGQYPDSVKSLLSWFSSPAACLEIQRRSAGGASGVSHANRAIYLPPSWTGRDFVQLST